jgi:delta-aminolevulinic acid dehydratase/porphobilinogen synthase
MKWYEKIIKWISIILKIIPHIEKLYPQIMIIVEIIKEENTNKGVVGAIKQKNVAEKIENNETTWKEKKEIVDSAVDVMKKLKIL